MITTEELVAGDCLAYGVSGLTSWVRFPFEHLVQLRTASPVYHVEVYVGDGLSVSADYRGVNAFPVNLEPARLHTVLRPRLPIDVEAGLAWFDRQARGQFYDAWGLVAFGASTDPLTKICSELACLFYRAAGLWLFPNRNPKTVYPGQFLTSRAFERAWTREGAV